MENRIEKETQRPQSPAEIWGCFVASGAESAGSVTASLVKVVGDQLPEGTCALTRFTERQFDRAQSILERFEQREEAPTTAAQATTRISWLASAVVRPN